MLTDDVATYLENNGYSNVFVTQYPNEPNAIISVHEYEKANAFGGAGINYGARTANIQIRIRRATIPQAEAEAWNIFKLIDSGGDETSIRLAKNRTATCRPAPPYFISIDTHNRVTYGVKCAMITCND